MRKALTGIVTSLAVGAAGSGHAAEMPLAATNCWAGSATVLATEAGLFGGSYSFRGTTVADDPEHPLHGTSYRCVGFAAFEARKQLDVGRCQGVDADGNTFLMSFDLVNGAGPLEFHGGTGPFEGMTGSSELTPVGLFPDLAPGEFQGCNRSKGTVSMP